VNNLKQEFIGRLEIYSNAKKNVEKDIQKFRAEINSKKDQKRSLLQDISVKEVFCFSEVK